MKKFTNKRKGVFQSISFSQKIAFFFLLFLLIAIPVTVFLSLKKTNYPSLAQISKIINIPMAAPSFGKALSLNGVDSFADVDNSENLNPRLGFTVEAWAKLNSFNAYATPESTENTFILYGKGGYPPAFKLWMSVEPRENNLFNINYFFSVSDKGYNAGSPTACTGGRGIDQTTAFRITGNQNDVLKWRHVAGVLQTDGTLEIYVDGKKTPYPVKFYEVCPNEEPAKIGAVTLISEFYPAQTKYLWNGLIDELRLSNIARYTSDFSPINTPFKPDTNTVSLYHFNNDLLDASGNDYHGTPSGNLTYADSVTVPTAPPIQPTQPPLTPVPGVCTPLTSSHEQGTLRLTLNKNGDNYTNFVAQISGKIDKVAVKAGNWGNAQKTITCRITDNNGGNPSSERSSALFVSKSGIDWRELNFPDTYTVAAGTTYRLYCKGDNIFWIYNTLRDPNSKTYRILNCSAGN